MYIAHLLSYSLLSLHLLSLSPGDQKKTVIESSGEPVSKTDTQSHDWIALAHSGWTAANSKDIPVGGLHLLFNSPEKVLLAFDYPHANLLVTPHGWSDTYYKCIHVTLRYVASYVSLSTTHTHTHPACHSAHANPVNRKCDVIYHAVVMTTAALCR